ncbi:NAD(P)-dependent oxidoreductase [Aquibium sp. A9E412]|uniref:NAD-dependent epimerase/dehydratase family protein n=1 Tax=Aquibium sp. A9E412 TaxID=2976767 RepID=UPI0025B09B02|nr:NAD(P)-dependent oxidoreductase [Aquibium sp. A9E412]MDN2565442.1 NAD(P)-dependent oxidoreductase [Aquibium sp. A9E412]
MTARPSTLVSGATGQVGRFLAEGLVAAGHRVVAAGCTPPAAGFFSPPLPFRPLSLAAAPDAALFAGVDVFVHAAFDHVPGRYRGGEGDDPAGFRRRNLDGSVALFEAARRAGVRRIVFLSSRAVYGRQPPGAPLAETTPPVPDTLYGEVKHAAETRLLAMGADGVVPVVLRATGVYGPAGPGRTHKWQGLFDDYLAGGAVAPRAGTEVHGRDLAAAVALLAGPAAGPGGVFNVSDLVVDRRTLLAIVRDATGCRHALPPAADCSALNVMDCARLRAAGWRPGGRPLLERTVRAMAAEMAP